MCYPGVYSAGVHDEYGYRRDRRLVVPAESTVVEGVGSQHVAAGGGGVTRQYCVCSPTRHPGSFRCRLHQREYEWAGRVVGPKSS